MVGKWRAGAEREREKGKVERLYGRGWKGGEITDYEVDGREKEREKSVRRGRREGEGERGERDRMERKGG